MHKALESLHRKILNSKLAEEVTEQEITALVDVIEKLKPKKILYRKQSYGTPWLCPECEADQIKVDFFHEDGSEPKDKHSYCWHCGQKLSWE